MLLTNKPHEQLLPLL